MMGWRPSDIHLINLGNPDFNEVEVKVEEKKKKKG
jgi:hypothetical protein